MKRLSEEFYNQAAEYLTTPATIEVDVAQVERIWQIYRTAFQVIPVQAISIATYAAPDYRIFDEGNEEINVEDDGWCFTETLIFKGGDIWLRWHQKHGGELLEVCVRRSEQ